jgi:hypothetical protein
VVVRTQRGIARVGDLNLERRIKRVGGLTTKKTAELKEGVKDKHKDGIQNRRTSTRLKYRIAQQRIYRGYLLSTPRITS